MALKVGCTVGEWPIKYLGIPLRGDLDKYEYWDLVVVKVSKHL